MYSGSGSFTKTARTQKIKETRQTQYIYQNELDKVSFQHDMVFADFKVQ